MTHYREAARQTGQSLDAFLPHRAGFPLNLGYIWTWFCALSEARGSGGFGASPITYPQIEAWARLMRTEVTPWEVGILRRLDRVFIEVVQSDGSRGTEPEGEHA